MQNPKELAIHQYLDDASKGKVFMSDTTIERVVNDVRGALKKQFRQKEKLNFKVRMSNVGRPSCQLWFEKNTPQKALPKPTTFIMNMMIGDIVEAVFKGLLTDAGVKFKDTEKVHLKLKDTTVSGSYDLIIDNSVDDIKSASDWSYKHKFESYDSLKEKDAFGYIAQLAGYAKASNCNVGGWWVINKATGEFKYVSASDMDVDTEIKKIESTTKKVTENRFERCFEAQDETFYNKPTGNKILGTTCSFCAYRFECWDNLKEIPSLVSQAKSPRIVPYVSIGKEYINGK